LVKVIARIWLGHASRAQQRRDAAREDARLARARAGDDEERRPAVGDRLALRLVETREKVVVGAAAPAFAEPTITGLMGSGMAPQV
jgi:hypothetical protein